jgi:hypothetical protein
LDHVGQVVDHAIIKKPFQIQQNWHVLQAFHKVKQVWTNPSLIIDRCHLITTNSKVPCYMNTSFSCNDNNAMHNFYNLPSNTIIPMFFGCLSKIETTFSFQK